MVAYASIVLLSMVLDSKYFPGLIHVFVVVGVAFRYWGRRTILKSEGFFWKLHMPTESYLDLRGIAFGQYLKISGVDA